MSEKKIIDLGALILEAMSDDNTLMPYSHANGVSIDTRNKLDGNKTNVEGYWTAPDTGERYYISADVTITPTEFSFCPPDDLYDEEGDWEEETE